MPIAESPSDMAQAMMHRVREMIDEGRSDAEILAYFTERYGEWVLLDPPSSGLNFWLWALPPLALACGLLLLRRYTGRTGPNTKAPERAASAPHTGTARGEPSNDPYLAAVRKEVES